MYNCETQLQSSKERNLECKFKFIGLYNSYKCYTRGGYRIRYWKGHLIPIHSIDNLRIVVRHNYHALKNKFRALIEVLLFAYVPKGLNSEHRIELDATKVIRLHIQYRKPTYGGMAQMYLHVYELRGLYSE